LDALLHDGSLLIYFGVCSLRWQLIFVIRHFYRACLFLSLGIFIERVYLAAGIFLSNVYFRCTLVLSATTLFFGRLQCPDSTHFYFPLPFLAIRSVFKFVVLYSALTLALVVLCSDAFSWLFPPPSPLKAGISTLSRFRNLLARSMFSSLCILCCFVLVCVFLSSFVLRVLAFLICIAVVKFSLSFLWLLAFAFVLSSFNFIVDANFCWTQFRYRTYPTRLMATPSGTRLFAVVWIFYFSDGWCKTLCEGKSIR
jgi:hypothetical protein